MSEKFSIPNCHVEFLSIRDFLENSIHNPSRPILEGFIIKAFLDGVLSKENIFEIEFSKSYYEYVGFEFEGGIAEVFFMNYFTKRTPKMHFLSTFKEKLRHPKMFEFSLKESLGAISDAFLSFYQAKIKDLLILLCYPFSIEAYQDTKQVFIMNSGETIPTKKSFFVPEGSGIIRLKKIYLGEERAMKISTIENTSLPYSAEIDIDCSFCERIILNYQTHKKEIPLEFRK